MARPATPPSTPPATVPDRVELELAELGVGQGVFDDRAPADAETRLRVFVVAADLETVMLVTDALVEGENEVDVARLVVEESKPPPNTATVLGTRLEVSAGKELLTGSTVLVAAPCRIVWVTVTVLGAAHESTPVPGRLLAEPLCQGKIILLNDCILRIGEAFAQTSWTKRRYCSGLAALVGCRMGCVQSPWRYTHNIQISTMHSPLFVCARISQQTMEYQDVLIIAGGCKTCPLLFLGCEACGTPRRTENKGRL